MLKLLLILAALGLITSPIALFFKLVTGRVKKQKQQSWQGKLKDKEHLEYHDDDEAYSKDLYTLIFETNNHQEIKLHAPKKIYDQWQVGDKAQKKTGELYPEKLT